MSVPATQKLRSSFFWALLPSLMIGVFLFALAISYGASIERSLANLHQANSRAGTLQSIQVATANYARRAYEVIYAHGLPQSELRGARLAMERGLARLSQDARTQATASVSEPSAGELLADLETARRLLELYHAIDAATSRAIVLTRDSRETEAARVYAREVEFRLTNEFEPILLGLTITKLQQADTLGRQSVALFEQAKWLIAALACALVPALFYAWFAHNRGRRSQVDPIALELRAKDLREANEQLRETDKRRAAFLADVSHELRTPLTILRGEADVALLAGSSPDERRLSLERIQRQAADMAQMLDDLLAFARSDAEDSELATSTVLIEDIVSLAVEDAENLAEPREINLRVNLDATGLWAQVDSRRFKQAIIVGLDNAINHSPPGSVVDVITRKTADDIEILVLDEGAGLNAEDEQRAFERFYRGDRSTNASGLGIGLAIARSIVEAHGGTISLTNRPEGGGKLLITLPRLKGSQR